MNPNRPQYPDENRGLSFALAVGMHAILAGFLLLSVQWKTKQPDPVVVELWGAPPPALVAQQPEVVKTEKVVKVKPDPIDPLPAKAPDIVTEKIKTTPTPRATPTPRPTPTPTAKPSATPTPAPKVTPQAKVTPNKVVKATPAPKAKSELEAALGMDALLGSSSEKPNPNAKVGGKAGGTGDTVGATGGAGKGKGNGVGAAYAHAVGQEIKQKINYSKTGSNPEVFYKIYLLPSGDIRDIVLVKASSDPAWDEAVKNAIQRFAPFPKPPEGATFNDYRDITWKFSPNK